MVAGLTKFEPARFFPAGVLAARVMRNIRVLEKLSVSAASLKWRVLSNPGGGYSGPWTFADAPNLRRPMDCLNPDNGYSMVAVMGPGQCGKSDIGNNWMLQTVLCDPANMMMLAPDKNILNDYVMDQIDRGLLSTTPELRERQLDGASADNRFIKQFIGSTWFFVWPVKSQLRARAVPRIRIDDFDAIPEDIDGEGSAIELLGVRQTTFEGWEKTYVNSSPALGASKGIEAVVAAGTDERWTVRCLHCSSPFILDFDNCLKFKSDGTADEARRSAVVVCRECGGVHEPRRKRELMATGDWVGAGQRMLADGSKVGELRATACASFRIDGLMGFSSWGRLAEKYRAAQITFEQTADEKPLQVVINARIGKNFESQVDRHAAIEASALVIRARAENYRLRLVPDGVICLTAGVDVQGNRFAVTVMGWGQGLESWLIDRFDIMQLEDLRTKIDPARHPEHWGTLVRRVLWARYALARDPETTIAVMNTAIDTGGLEGVTDNAFQFAYSCYRLNIPPTALTLVKGGSNPKGRLLPPPTIDVDRGRKNKRDSREPDAELYVPNVHRVKDMIDARLRRAEPGPLFVHLPADVDEAHLQELTAERKVGGLWERLPGRPNETFDGLVYATVALIRHAGGDTSLSWVPDWARPARGESRAAVPPPPEVLPPAPVAAEASHRARPLNISFRRS